MATIDFHREAARLVLSYRDDAVGEVGRRIEDAEQRRAVEEAFYWAAVREAVIDLEEHRRAQTRERIAVQHAEEPPLRAEDENAVSYAV